jgi:threonine synthase
MKLCSTRNPQLSATFLEAVERGTPGDGGLYMPREIPAFPDSFIRSLHGMSFQELSFQVARLLIDGEIPGDALRRIVDTSITFPAPLHSLDEHTAVLELFHGPTLAFKDFGARFIAGVMSYIHKGDHAPITVLVATSGDTGSAVAHGFRGAEGISVVLLYPSGRVAPLQELQLTTAGNHVTALEIAGTFDDCQRLVKHAFADADVCIRRKLTSANSINIARLVPQTFYYFNALAQLDPDAPPAVFAVPSGNLGNLTAGLIAATMGLPAQRFVAGSNANDTLIRFLATGAVRPAQAVATMSSAMDVGDPSNLARIIALFNDDIGALRNRMEGWAVTDQETRESIRSVFERYGYIMDPHTAVAWRALSKYSSQARHPYTGIVLSTAHPAKFQHLLDEAVRQRVQVPEALGRLRPEMKRSVRLSARFDEFKEFLLQSKQ